MSWFRWLTGDTRECADGRYIGERVPRTRSEPPSAALWPPGGMYVDPAQTPTALTEPSMEAGQPPSGTIQACYARLLPERKVARTVEVSDDVMVDVDADGRPVGVETLDGSDWASALASLAMRGRVRIV